MGSWIMVDVFECCQQGWTRTAIVLDNIRKRLDEIHLEGCASSIRVMFLCGADLLETLCKVKPDGTTVWPVEHQHIILEQNGIACLEREGVDMEALIDGTPLLSKNRANIHIVKSPVANNISSTVIRQELPEGSVKYLVPDPVIQYMAEHDLASKPQWQA